ncbi:TetR/AcrR family transcriptional regulator [Halalkalibacter krulwichiae]|uniref:HTH-type transcriptional repressor KstR2 n=1 Tax=Halalkalibacter krulwichiae TaxID=199441 RepID=A0A1X9MDU6_9BACI|nr:TetR/AcrR family transcriptional regulator [Halalkalibacter krulwichiae]ARK29721.1 HTH-type transcriptional repressor KstR2 [Halalkalibacter krulwichiae]
MAKESSNVTRRMGKDTKTEILDIALSLFVQKGYHQTSMRDIAETAGFTKGGLYYYVTSKDDILYFLHDRFIKEGLSRLRLVAKENLSPERKLIKLLKTHLEIIHLYKNDITLFFEAIKYLTPERYHEVRKKRESYENLFVKTIEEGRELGVFQVKDSRITVLYILGACNFMHTWYDPNGKKSIEELSELFIELTMEGLNK